MRGAAHYAPNSLRDYDWGNQTAVPSACDDYFNYPTLPGTYLPTSCTAWSCDGYAHKTWWLSHLPHSPGTSSGTQNNWWKYVADYDHW